MGIVRQVIVWRSIALGGNYPGTIVFGGNCLGAIVWETIILGGSCLGENCQGGSRPGAHGPEGN